jgi:hypothetical protein
MNMNPTLKRRAELIPTLRVEDNLSQQRIELAPPDRLNNALDVG